MISNITIGWLVNMLLATGSNRDHGKNLEVLKSLRDADSARHGTLFTAIAGGAVTLLAGFGTIVYKNATDRHELGSTTVEGVEATVVTKQFSEAGLGDADSLLLVLLGLFAFVVVAFLIANRLGQRQVDLAYSNAVSLYFFLSRHIP
ncbi:MAG TPA: hypothetical protein VI876_05940 [Dehalococcoidia bacterium]|nr:hypothetical protein [Dehalococcoidia bacterium]